MTTSGKTQGKFILVIALLVVLLVAWEAKRLWEPVPVSTPAPVPVVVPLPVVKKEEPLPAAKPPAAPLPPIKKEKKKPAAPKPTLKKTVPALKTSLPPPSVHAPTIPVAPPTPIPPVFVPPVPPELLEWQGTDTSVTHTGQVVIHNDRQWIHFWSEHHPHEAAPDVDFTRNMVIGVFAGPRPAEPFSIRIVNVSMNSDSLVADYREKLPPTGTFAVNVTVYPYDIKVIPRSTLPVKFNLLQPENQGR